MYIDRRGGEGRRVISHQVLRTISSLPWGQEDYNPQAFLCGLYQLYLQSSKSQDIASVVGVKALGQMLMSIILRHVRMGVEPESAGSYDFIWRLSTWTG